MVSSQYFSSLKLEEKDAYSMKLSELGFLCEEDDPFIVDESISKEIWSSPVESWPEVEFGNIYVFLLECPDYTPKSLKTYKSLDAYKCFANGFVHHLAIRQSLTGHSIIRARVKRSQASTTEPHRTWVGLNNEDGNIITGHCTCMAGTSPICIHVAALVFQIESASRQGYQEKACTCCPPPTISRIDAKQSCGSKVFAEASAQGSCKEDLVRNPPADLTSLTDSHEVAGDIKDSNEIIYVFMDTDQSGTEHMDQDGQSQTTITVVADTDDLELDLNDLHFCKSCNMGFTAGHLLESHMEQEHLQSHLEVKSESGEAQTGVGQENGCSEVATAKEEKLQGFADIDDLMHNRSCNVSLPPNVSSESGTESHAKEKDLSVSEEVRNAPSVPKKAGPGRNKTDVSRRRSLRSGNRGVNVGRSSVGVRKKTKNVKEEVKTSEDIPLKCVECDKSFSNGSNYYRHVRLHKEKPFLCDICNRRFRSNNELKRHVKIHTDEMPFQCETCDRKFKCNSSLKRHKKIHFSEHPIDVASLRYHKQIQSSETPVKCGECGKRFKSHFCLTRHMNKHKREKFYTCSQCLRYFVNGSLLKKHIMKTHAGDKTFTCGECGKCFKYKASLVHHKRTHSRRPPGCQQCENGFSDEFSLLQHMEEHVADRPSVTCDKCEKKCKTEYHLQVHRRTHDTDGTFQCNECGKRFSKRCFLQYHKETHSQDKQFMCHQCGKSFRRLKYLKSHMVQHAKKSFKCKECGMAFHYSCNLRRHIRIHTGEKPFVCNYCGVAFTQQNILKSHIEARHSDDGKLRVRRKSLSRLSAGVRMHLGEKPFQCLHCDKRFRSELQLQDHMKRHAGEKPHVCHFCGVGFFWKNNLQRHTRIHTGEKPYTCQVCGKAFRQVEALTVHKRTHTGERPYKCSVCGQAFSESRSLRKHAAKHLVETPEELSKVCITLEGNCVGGESFAILI